MQFNVDILTDISSRLSPERDGCKDMIRPWTLNHSGLDVKRENETQPRSMKIKRDGGWIAEFDLFLNPRICLSNGEAMADLHACVGDPVERKGTVVFVRISKDWIAKRIEIWTPGQFGTGLEVC
jgi:hypothetical protein